MSASAITSSMHKTWPSAGSPKTAKFLSKSKGHRLQNGYLRYRIVTLSRGTIVDHCHHYKDVLMDMEVWTLPWLVVCSNRAVGEGGSRLCACASLGDRSAPSGWTSRVTILMIIVGDFNAKTATSQIMIHIFQCPQVVGKYSKGQTDSNI